MNPSISSCVVSWHSVSGIPFPQPSRWLPLLAHEMRRGLKSHWVLDPTSFFPPNRRTEWRVGTGVGLFKRRLHALAAHHWMLGMQPIPAWQPHIVRMPHILPSTDTLLLPFLFARASQLLIPSSSKIRNVVLVLIGPFAFYPLSASWEGVQTYEEQGEMIPQSLAVPVNRQHENAVPSHRCPEPCLASLDRSCPVKGHQSRCPSCPASLRCHPVPSGSHRNNALQDDQTPSYFPFGYPVVWSGHLHFSSSPSLGLSFCIFLNASSTEAACR
ncbi:hypothetical protein SODALDRAFT_212615 [Sodiomyces alkalinus F11]|uniref:Uncharacterized protein n=1 Tax=Sodiomyces alkalinus (strain CBS 110278 / VKM F-3762 / F11) TaxID=1314773 RepID=A0A3N2PRA4_SODAK|nr:hypothetical protein SODALDRAFT_212615 [Sodiomyces alkalinus F11]ROT37000.1 hypothetical protein SODALDRAFT_212615 [Sodiomyces alkalinus F11]